MPTPIFNGGNASSDFDVVINGGVASSSFDDTIDGGDADGHDEPEDVGSPAGRTVVASGESRVVMATEAERLIRA